MGKAFARPQHQHTEHGHRKSPPGWHPPRYQLPLNDREKHHQTHPRALGSITGLQRNPENVTS